MNVVVLDPAKINELVRLLSHQWLEEYGSKSNKALAGEEILHLTPSKQVNLFILFQISQEWSNTIRQVEKCPFIDFQAEELRELMKNLRTAGLKHILVTKETLKPILEQAIYNTIKLILEPVGTLTKFFYGNQGTVSLSVLKKYSPYFDLFDFVIQSILTYMTKNQIETMERHLFEEKVKRVLEVFQKKRNVTLDQLREELFKQLTGKHLQELLQSKPPIEIEKKTSSLQTGSITIDTDEEMILKNLFGAELPSASSDRKSPTEKKSSGRSNPLLSAIDTSPQLHQQFKKADTLKDTLEQKIKISEIPLHKQYQYVEQLFNGDNILFKHTIDKINQMTSYDEALNFLREEVFSKTKPDPNNYLLDEFLSYIKKQLSA